MDEDSPFLKDDEPDCGVAIPRKLALERIEALYGHDNRGVWSLSTSGMAARPRDFI
jgi:hypothetical protein